MTTLQQVDKRIRELVDSLQELSFGCEVLQNGSKRTLNKSYKKVTTQSGEVVYEATSEKGNLVCSLFDEILGHPIQLHHVLQAIYKTRKGKMYSQSLGNTMRVQNRHDEEELGTIRMWDLSKDLNNQSEETINFVWEILK